MQLLIVSASVFQRHLVPGNPGDPTTQYEILLSVTDTSGEQIHGLVSGNISCFMDFIEVVGIAPATVTEVNEYGKGLYRVLVDPGTFQGSNPRLLAVIVEQYEETGFRKRSVTARGQLVTTVIHRVQCCTLNPTVNGVVAAYYAINTKGIKIDIDGSGVPIGDYQGNEHFQGIQLLKRGATDPGKLVITSSSSVSGGFFVECEMSLDGLSGFAVSAEEMAKVPLNHAGGFQAFGHCFVGGVENHNGNSMSEVQFWDLKGFPRKLAPMTIPRIGKGKQSTAGAVGISSFRTGAVVAVGSYNSATIDF